MVRGRKSLHDESLHISADPSTRKIGMWVLLSFKRDRTGVA